MTATQPQPGAGARPTWLRMPQLPDGLLEALWLFVLLRIGFSVLGLFVYSKGVPAPCHFEVALDGWMTIPPLAEGPVGHPLVGIWQRWDACWYSKIATFGYEVGEDSTAFFPAWPMLMRVGALLAGGNVALGGLLMAALAFVTALTGLYRLVARDFDDVIARRTLLFIAVTPAALFFLAPFTESLFLASTVWAVVAARERRWTWAVLAGAIAGVTRLQGVFIVLPIAWEAWHAWREQRAVQAAHAVAGGGEPVAADGTGTGTGAAGSTGAARSTVAARSTGAAGSTGSRRPWPMPSIWSLVAMVAPVVTFAVFIVFTKVAVGTTPFDSQDVWGGRNFHWPWELLDAALRWMVDKGDAMTAVNIGVLSIVFVALVGGLRVLPVAYLLIAIPQLALVSIRIQPTPMTSIVRYMDVIFPAYVVFALWMDGRRREQLWAILSTLLMGALTWLFVKGDFVA